MKHAASAAAVVGSSPLLFGALLLGSTQPGHWSAVASELETPDCWFTLVVILLFGAFGGFCYELLLRKGTIELPHRVRPNTGRVFTHAAAKDLFALGVVGRMLVGAAAAVGVLVMVSPSSAQAAAGLAVTSGASAPALIRLLRKQLMFAADALGRLTRERHDPEPARRRAAAHSAA